MGTPLNPSRHDSTTLLLALQHSVAVLARAHGHRDKYTCHHQERVAHIAVSIGLLMNLRQPRLEILRLAALVHDIGKLGIPAEIVCKPGKLSDAEYALMKTHCEIGRDILMQHPTPFPLADIVHQHHERHDGSGYPRGLHGIAVLEEARILAVADTFDAMSSYRPYRAPLSEDFVLGELQKMAGQSLDRAAVEACIKHVLSGAASHHAEASAVAVAINQNA